MKTTNYDNQAGNWKRNKAMYPSDFIVRPIVFDLFKKLGKNKIVLDIGCGEGYFSRKMAPIAKKIIAFDNSKKMIDLAIEQNLIDKYNIDYKVADMMDMGFVKSSSVDVCICNLSLHYNSPDKYLDFFKNIKRILRPRGKIILSSPHPYYYFSNMLGGVVKYNDITKFDYIKSRGKYFSGTIRTITGEFLHVGVCHATMEDYLNSIADAGLKLEKFIEPPITKGLLKEYKNIGKIDELPTYIILQASK